MLFICSHPIDANVPGDSGQHNLFTGVTFFCVLWPDVPRLFCLGRVWAYSCLTRLNLRGRRVLLSPFSHPDWVCRVSRSSSPLLE